MENMQIPAWMRRHRVLAVGLGLMVAATAVMLLELAVAGLCSWVTGEVALPLRILMGPVSLLFLAGNLVGAFMVICGLVFMAIYGKRGQA